MTDFERLLLSVGSSIILSGPYDRFTDSPVIGMIAYIGDFSFTRTTLVGKYWMTSADTENHPPAGSQPADVVKDPLEETAVAR